MSASGIEAITALQWIVSHLKAALSGLVGTRVYPHRGRSATYPQVVIRILSAGVPVQGVGGSEPMTAVVLSATVIGKNQSVDILTPVVIAMHDALQATKNQSIASGIITSCNREQNIFVPETVDDVEFFTLGATYRLLVS